MLKLNKRFTRRVGCLLHSITPYNHRLCTLLLFLLHKDTFTYFWKYKDHIAENTISLVSKRIYFNNSARNYINEDKNRIKMSFAN